MTKCQSCGTRENVSTYHGVDQYNYWCQSCAVDIAQAQAEYETYIESKYGKIPTISDYFNPTK